MIMTKQSVSQEGIEARSVEDFMTIDEAMRYSGYTEQYLRRMSRAGRIEAIKFGRFWMVNRQSLETYMATVEQAEDKRFGPRRPQG